MKTWMWVVIGLAALWYFTRQKSVTSDPTFGGMVSPAGPVTGGLLG